MKIKETVNYKPSQTTSPMEAKMGNTGLYLTRNVVSTSCKMLLVFLIMVFSIATPNGVFAQDSVCAVVKIEIRQELTLERQAFDAHMIINNGLSHLTLENVKIEVFFTDKDNNHVESSSDPSDTSAMFFIRPDTKTGIDDIDGNGTVNPSSSADIHWFILPNPGASDGREQGTLYNVGATLTYDAGGKQSVINVSPDYIYVKPMPELELDYFLPEEVFGDDSYTPEIEPEIPFSLGVRVKNIGAGVAHELKIESAQPKIIGNESGLLIGFALQGTWIDGKPDTDSLLADFGDILPNASAMARWIMTCTRSGKFSSFTVAVSHSDELGGQLTALIKNENVHSHFLVRDVLVDLPGSDSQHDFLAKDGTTIRIYESQDRGTDTVTDLSDQASLVFEGQVGAEFHYRLESIPTAGFMYASLPDPYNGQKGLKSILRSDGKQIKPENAWLSKTRGESHTWKYWINLFDANTTSTYAVVYGDISAAPAAPVIADIPEITVTENEQVSFNVNADDPNGDPVVLSASYLPAGASFTDQGNGVAIFDWIPAVGQAGQYSITLKASDGVLQSSRTARITVLSSGADDTDNDGMSDAWELKYFGTLDRDGTGDFDGDGISDLNEYLLGTNPTSVDLVPGTPTVMSPLPGDTVTDLRPTLIVRNSYNPGSTPVTHTFELFADAQYSILINRQADISESSQTTSWQVPQNLSDNTTYFWRVKSSAGIPCSNWAYGSFFVNTHNDPPGIAKISSPKDGSTVDTLTPALEVTNAIDVDADVLHYVFEIYTDVGLGTLLASSDSLGAGEHGTTHWEVPESVLLTDNTTYYWRAVVTDTHGALSNTSLASFQVLTSNDTPLSPLIDSPLSGEEIRMDQANLTVYFSRDAVGAPLFYWFELDKKNTFDSFDLKQSPKLLGGSGKVVWPVSDLADNTQYYWRVRADDCSSQSPWTCGTFRVNLENDAPLQPVKCNPGDTAWVKSTSMTLSAFPVLDPDMDPVSYEFEVYTDRNLTQLVDSAIKTSPSHSVSLIDATQYFWRVRSVDSYNVKSPWSGTGSFYVKAQSSALGMLQVHVVIADSGLPLKGVSVYAYDLPADVYNGIHVKTNDSGVAVLDMDLLGVSECRFKVDYQGETFWTEVITVPEITETTLAITPACPVDADADNDIDGSDLVHFVTHVNESCLQFLSELFGKK